MEWNSDIATALCVAANGWQTEEERVVWMAAEAFVRKVRNQAMASMAENPKCPACGRETDGTQR